MWISYSSGRTCVGAAKIRAVCTQIWRVLMYSDLPVLFWLLNEFETSRLKDRAMYMASSVGSPLGNVLNALCLAENLP